MALGVQNISCQVLLQVLKFTPGNFYHLDYIGLQIVRLGRVLLLWGNNIKIALKLLTYFGDDRWI